MIKESQVPGDAVGLVPFLEGSSGCKNITSLYVDENGNPITDIAAAIPSYDSLLSSCILMSRQQQDTGR